MQVVREHYGHFAKEEGTLRVRFVGSKITLDIPEDGLVTDEGWKIIPFSHPTVSVACPYIAVIITALKTEVHRILLTIFFLTTDLQERCRLV